MPPPQVGRLVRPEQAERDPAQHRRSYVQKSVSASGNAKYISYERTSRACTSAAATSSSSPTRRARRSTRRSRRPRRSGTVDRPEDQLRGAEAAASKQLKRVNSVEGTSLVVYTLDGSAKLAYETTVTAPAREGASRLTVDVDALTGAVLNTQRARHGRHRHRLDRRHGHHQHHAVRLDVLDDGPDAPEHRLPGRRRTTRRSPAPTTSGATATAPTGRPAASTRSTSAQKETCCRVAGPQRHQRQRRRLADPGRPERR